MIVATRVIKTIILMCLFGNNGGNVDIVTTFVNKNYVKRITFAGSKFR